MDIPVIKSILPGVVSMKPNTALCFALAGAGLALLSGAPHPGWRKRMGQLLGLVVAAIGAASLCEYMFGLNLGIDEFLFRDNTAAVGTSHPGRMTLSTAISFPLVGLALLLTHWEPRRGFRPAELLCVIPFLMGLLSLAEYSAGDPILYEFGMFTRMAIHTAVAFLALSVGVMTMRPAQGWIGRYRWGDIRSADRKLYGAAAGFALLVLAAGGWFYHAQRDTLRRQAEDLLDTIAKEKVQQIEAWRENQLAEGVEINASFFFSAGVARWLEESRAQDLDNILSRFRGLRAHYGYQDVMLVDTQGRTRLSLSGRTEPIGEQAVRALALSFLDRKPVLTDLTMIRPQFPVLDTVAPIYPGDGVEGDPIGAVILRSDARQSLYPLVQSWPVPSRSAESLLVRREGESVLFLNELRHRSNTAFKLSIPLDRTDVPAVMAVLGRRGVATGRDYRGVPVVASFYPVPGSPWFLVAKMDEAEALAAWRTTSSLIVGMLIALVICAVIAALVIQQRGQRLHWAALYQAEQQAQQRIEHLNAVLRAIRNVNQLITQEKDPDALVRRSCEALTTTFGCHAVWMAVCDPEGRPVFAAEHGFGKKFAALRAQLERGEWPDCCRRALSRAELVVIHDTAANCAGCALAGAYPDTAAVACAMRHEGRMFGVLVIALPAAMANDREAQSLFTELAGDIAFALHSIDIENSRKRAETSLREKDRMLSAAQKIAHVGSWSVPLDTMRGQLSEEACRILGVDPVHFVATMENFLGLIHSEDKPAMERWLQDCVAGRHPQELEFRIVRPDGTVRHLCGRGDLHAAAGDAGPRLIGSVQDITERKKAEADLRVHVEELERWRRNTVDRELRMTAVKQEVNALLAQSGQPPRYPGAEKATVPPSGTAQKEGLP